MAAFVQHLRVDHGGADVLVTEQFLDGPDIVPGLKEVRAPEKTPGTFSDASQKERIAHQSTTPTPFRSARSMGGLAVSVPSTFYAFRPTVIDIDTLKLAGFIESQKVFIKV